MALVFAKRLELFSTMKISKERVLFKGFTEMYKKLIINHLLVFFAY